MLMATVLCLAALQLACCADPTKHTCTSNAGTQLANTDFTDTDGPRTAMNATDCCDQCIKDPKCQYWSYQVDEKAFPGVQQCRWAHMTYCCYFHTTNTDAIKNASWTSGSFTGTKPGPPPPPPGPCAVASQAECGVGSGP